jgi:hypothetical protein
MEIYVERHFYVTNCIATIELPLCHSLHLLKQYGTKRNIAKADLYARNFLLAMIKTGEQLHRNHLKEQMMPMRAIGNKMKRH